MSARGPVDTGTLGIKAVMTPRLARAVFALGGERKGTDSHGWHVFDVAGSRVIVPSLGRGEIGRSHLAKIIGQLRRAGVPPAVIRAAMNDVGCVWYTDPPADDLEEGMRMLRTARRKGVIPTVENIIKGRTPDVEPAPPPQASEEPQIQYGEDYWSGIEHLREAVVMGLPNEGDPDLIHAAAKTVGRLIAQRKGFVTPLLEGHQIERYNLGTEHTPRYRYRMTELAVTQIAEYAHRKWIEKHGADEPEPEPEPEVEVAPQPEPEPAQEVAVAERTAPEPERFVAEPEPEPKPKRFVGSPSAAIDVIHGHLGVMPSFRRDVAGLVLDVDAYLVALARALEDRAAE